MHKGLLLLGVNDDFHIIILLVIIDKKNEKKNVYIHSNFSVTHLIALCFKPTTQVVDLKSVVQPSPRSVTHQYPSMFVVTIGCSFSSRVIQIHS